MGLTRSHQVPGHPGPARHDPMMSRHGAALGWAPLVARWDLHLRCRGWVRMLGQLGRCTSWICSWIVNALHRSSWIPRVSSCPCINNPKTTLVRGNTMVPGGGATQMFPWQIIGWYGEDQQKWGTTMGIRVSIANVHQCLRYSR